jgi:hypothetical protein
MNPAWWFAAAAVLVWVILAVVPARPVGVRFAPVGGLALTVAMLRLVLIPMGYPIEGLGEWSAWVGAMVVGLGLIVCRRFCLVRTTPQALREQIEWACKGLFLTCAEGKNQFVFSHKQANSTLSWFSVSSGWQLLRLPTRRDSAKVALLVDWLAKQYPGPFPRMRIAIGKGVSHGNGDI